jgi:hypothetical protein
MSTILFIKARDLRDTHTSDMFATHLETRTRKDGVTQQYHVAAPKPAAPAHAGHDSRREAMAAFDGERSDAVALKRGDKWLAVRRSEAEKHLADGWKDPSGEVGKPATVSEALRDLAGSKAKSIDFDSLTYLKNTVGLKGLSEDEARHVGNAISLISHMRDTGRLSGTHMLQIRDKLRGKAVLDMVEQVAARMKEVRDPLDAVREYFYGRENMTKALVFLRPIGAR